MTSSRCVRGAVDRGRGEPGQRHCRRADLVLLCVPFRGDRFGESGARHDELVLRRGAHRPSVERDAPTAFGRARGRPVCTRASCRQFQLGERVGRIRVKPEKLPHPAHMRRQRRGDGTASRLGDAGSRGERACRCSRCDAAPPGSCAPAPPYLPSPRIGVPSAAQCARNWCVRPVTGNSASQLARRRRDRRPCNR